MSLLKTDIAASPMLKDTLDEHFAGIRTATERETADAWHEIKFPIDSAEHEIVEHIQEVNVWCERRFKTKPVYSLQKRNRDVFTEHFKGKSTAIYDCEMTMPDPEDPTCELSFCSEGPTRSTARTHAAEKARRFLQENGFWMNIADAKIEPQLDLAVNQLQELYQKKYVDKAEYEFSRDGRVWTCTCTVANRSTEKHGYSKPESKKKAAYAMLVSLMRSSGLFDPEWYRILGDDAPIYLDELVAFDQAHKDATLYEKYRFVVSIQNAYDRDVAADKFSELEGYEEDSLNADGAHHLDFVQEIGIAHRNIGISLCEAMKLDYNDFYNWKRSGMMEM